MRSIFSCVFLRISLIIGKLSLTSIFLLGIFVEFMYDVILLHPEICHNLFRHVHFHQLFLHKCYGSYLFIYLCLVNDNYNLYEMAMVA